MANKSRNRELKRAWKAKQLEQAKAGLPYPRQVIVDLLQYLDAELSERACEHNLALTTLWTNGAGLDVDRITSWTRENGGYCDCEVLANVPSNPAIDDY